MCDLKLLVSCHQPFFVPEHPFLVPVQVGTALRESRFEGFCHDDEGENISSKNLSYCELTALYWAWKNVSAKAYGLFHYRRYLYPDCREKQPYRMEKEPQLSLLEQLDFDRLGDLAEQYDLILPKGENMYLSVREHYASAPYHHKKDLDLVEQIIRERWPEYVPAMDAYLSQSICYFGNICIMKKDVLQDYCSWLFDILSAFDDRCDMTGYGVQEKRVNGYLAERLLGVYSFHHRQDLSILELPRLHFEPDDKVRRKRKQINFLLPPGSKRRMLIKKYMRRK